jgi:hypothetical protein
MNSHERHGGIVHVLTISDRGQFQTCELPFILHRTNSPDSPDSALGAQFNRDLRKEKITTADRRNTAARSQSEDRRRIRDDQQSDTEHQEFRRERSRQELRRIELKAAGHESRPSRKSGTAQSEIRSSILSSSASNSSYQPSSRVALRTCSFKPPAVKQSVLSVRSSSAFNSFD